MEPGNPPPPPRLRQGPCCFDRLSTLGPHLGVRKRVGLEPHHSQRNPGVTTYQLCDVGEVIKPLCASVFFVICKISAITVHCVCFIGVVGRNELKHPAHSKHDLRRCYDDMHREPCKMSLERSFPRLKKSKTNK